jgi:hypothetical protein
MDWYVPTVVSEAEVVEAPGCDPGEMGSTPITHPIEDKLRGVTPVLGAGSAGFDSQVLDHTWGCNSAAEYQAVNLLVAGSSPASPVYLNRLIEVQILLPQSILLA